MLLPSGSVQRITQQRLLNYCQILQSHFVLRGQATFLDFFHFRNFTPDPLQSPSSSQLMKSRDLFYRVLIVFIVISASIADGQTLDSVAHRSILKAFHRHVETHPSVFPLESLDGGSRRLTTAPPGHTRSLQTESRPMRSSYRKRKLHGQLKKQMVDLESRFTQADSVQTGSVFKQGTSRSMVLRLLFPTMVNA